MILASSHVGSEMAQKNAIMRLRKEVRGRAFFGAFVSFVADAA